MGHEFDSLQAVKHWSLVYNKTHIKLGDTCSVDLGSGVKLQAWQLVLY